MKLIYNYIMPKIFLLLFFCFFSKNIFAITAGEIIEGYKNTGTRDSVLIYMNGAGDATMWSSVYSKIHFKQELFCRPGDLRLDGEGYYQILKEEYFRNIQEHKDMSSNHLLIKAMIRKWPCE